MSVREDQRAEDDNAAGESWLARFIAFILSLLDTYAHTSPRAYRAAAESNPDWRDHWPAIRACEWHREQLIAREAMQLLTGQPIPFHLIEEPPESYIGPCPKTPAALARRYVVSSRWLREPDAFILRHARRLARRMGLTYRGFPLRLDAARRSTSPGLRPEEERRLRSPRAFSSSDAKHRGRWHARACAHDGGGERRRRRRDLIQWIKSRSERPGRGSHRIVLNAQPRAPPTIPDCRLPTAYCLKRPAFEVAPARPNHGIFP